MRDRTGLENYPQAGGGNDFHRNVKVFPHFLDVGKHRTANRVKLAMCSEAGMHPALVPLDPGLVTPIDAFTLTLWNGRLEDAQPLSCNAADVRVGEVADQISK